MDLKIEIDIKLSYIIRLLEAKDYTFNLEFSRTAYFILDLKHNNEEDVDSYNEQFDNNVCQFIRIEVILQNIDVKPIKISKYFKSQDNETAFTYEFAPKDKTKIFDEVKQMLNKVLSYLRKETNMFWIDEIKTLPITFSNSMNVEYMIYSPNAYLNKDIKYCRSEDGNYMRYISSPDMTPVTDFTFTNFNERYQSQLYEIFLDRALTALFSRNLEEFLIYGAIVIDSYIEHFFKMNRRAYSKEERNQYKQIQSNKNQTYIDKKYDKLLKLLIGKSLKEIDEVVFNDLHIIYKLRNTLMHEGYISDERLNSLNIDKLDFNICEKFMKQIYKMINTLEKISGLNF